MLRAQCKFSRQLKAPLTRSSFYPKWLFLCFWRRASFLLDIDFTYNCVSQESHIDECTQTCTHYTQTISLPTNSCSMYNLEREVKKKLQVSFVYIFACSNLERFSNLGTLTVGHKKDREAATKIIPSNSYMWNKSKC